MFTTLKALVAELDISDSEREAAVEGLDAESVTAKQIMTGLVTEEVG